jgi:lipopolysaccharide heptosyltransferase I
MEATGAALSPTANVLIVRLSAIGDCLETLPMACALKDRYPRCHITWVVERSAAPLLRGHSAIDDLLELPKGWAKSPTIIWRLREMLRRRSYEIAFDPQGLSKSAGVAWIAGARRRIGLASPYGRELSLWLNRVLIQPANEHVVDRQLEMLQTVGVRWPAVRFDVPVCPEATKAVAAWLDSPRYVQGFLVINPGATWDSKLWPVERYGEVAAAVLARWNLPSVVVWGGQRERQWAEEIAASSQGAAFVAPPTTLPELAAVLRRATLYVSSDTGPMHLAAAVGTPCVGLFGPTRPENVGPYGADNIAVQAYYQAGTSRQRRAAPNDAMRAIRCEMVIEALGRRLERATARKAA